MFVTALPFIGTKEIIFFRVQWVAINLIKRRVVLLVLVRDLFNYPL